MEHSVAPNRLMWTTIVFAFIGSVVMYGVLAYMLEHSGPRTVAPSLEPMRLPATLLGIVSVAISVLWAQTRLSVRADPSVSPSNLPSPWGFVVHTVIALAFAESCAVFGLLLFFLGASLTDFALFAVPSVAVMLFVVLPKGGAYWQAWESQQEG